MSFSGVFLNPSGFPRSMDRNRELLPPRDGVTKAFTRALR